MHGMSARHRSPDLRRVIHRSAQVLVEEASYGGALPSKAGHSPEFQVAFLCRGLLEWRVGRRSCVLDANQVLFVTGGEDFSESFLDRAGMACLLLTPAPDVLETLAGVDLRLLSQHPNFARQARASPLHARLWVHQLRTSDLDMLAAEETSLSLLRSVLSAQTTRVAPTPRTRRLLDRVKETLHARAGEAMSLDAIAREVGVTPIYLTQLFKAAEGVSLHRYLVDLRLSRAVEVLPEGGDLTDLALELGFCSHSHFTAAFHRAFGVTPSQLRNGAQGGKRRRAELAAPMRSIGAGVASRMSARS